MSKTKVFEVHPDLLRSNDWNVNFMTAPNEAKLAASIDRFDGLFKPILVREVAGVEGYEILGGEHRWIVAKSKKLALVPIWNLGEIDDKKAKEISLADNARYGADDTLALGELLKELTVDGDDLQDYLPYSDVDLHAIFSSDIALDELSLDEIDDKPKETVEEPVTRPVKTHTIMRFNIANEDAERLTAALAKIQKFYGYSSADQMTNAGDALMQMVIDAIVASEDES
jgi:hypothetical protein